MSAALLARNSFLRQSSPSSGHENRGVLQGATVRLAGRSVVRQPAILRHDRILVPRCLAPLPFLSPLPLSSSFCAARAFFSGTRVLVPSHDQALFYSLLGVFRSTRNNSAIHTRYTRLSTKVDYIALVRALRTSGKHSRPRHFRCAGIRTMNELACVVIAPTLRTDLSGQISFDNIHVPRRFDTHEVWPPFRDAGKQPSE